MKRTHLFLALAALAALSASARAADRVLIIPFNVLNVPASQQWIGQGVRESLIADLGRGGSLTPIAFGGQVIVEDNATAARLARAANAPLAIRGSAQTVGDSVRLTAQLIDSRTGDTLRTALVTGAASNLLQLEDDLARQIRTPPAPPSLSPAALPAPVSAAAAPPQIIIISQPQPAYNLNDPYSYNYPYVYYPQAVFPVNAGSRGRGRNGGTHNGGANTGPAGGGPIIQNAPGGMNASSLPLSTDAVLPLPTGGVLPLPTGGTLPLPTNFVLPLAQNQSSPLPANHFAPLPALSPAATPGLAGPAARPARSRAN